HSTLTTTLPIYTYMSDGSPTPPPLHSFPTRRSSDLARLSRSAPRAPRSVRLRRAVPPGRGHQHALGVQLEGRGRRLQRGVPRAGDRKSTRLNSSHGSISYAVFCLKKKI